MRITIVTPVYLPSMGGLQIHAREIAMGLQKKGHDITVVTANTKNPWLWFFNEENGKYKQEETIDDIKVIRLSPRFKRFWKCLYYFCYKSNIPGSYRISKWIFGDNLELFRGPWGYGKKVIRETNPDFIILYAPYFRLIYDCLYIRKVKSVPLVTIPLFHTIVQKVEKYQKDLLTTSDIIFTMTILETNTFVANGISPDKMHILGCGLNPEEISYPLCRNEIYKKYNLKNTFNICYIGRLDVDKGVLDLIKAFELISEKTEDVSLVLAGSRIENTVVIMQHIEQLPATIKARIIVIFDLEEADKHSLITCMDVLVLPSIAESFGIVILEAWINKKPAIACADTPPGVIVTEGQGGLCYEYKNNLDLAQKILQLKNNPSVAKTMGENGYRIVNEKYTWDKIVDKFLKIVDDAL